MRPTPVVWTSYHNSPNRGYWDQALIEWLLGESGWRPPHAGRLRHLEGPDAFDQLRPDEGLILVTPGHGGQQAISRIQADLEGRSWVLWLVTSDEESAFEWWRVTHPNLVVWRQYHRTDLAWRPDRVLPCGFTTGTRAHYSTYPTAPDRPNGVVFSGQVTPHPEHRRRREMMDAYEQRRHPEDVVQATPGFAQGLEPDAYRDLLASGRIALCPTGYQSTDTLRLYEALEAGCTPIVDRLGPDGRDGFYAMAFPDGVPFPLVTDWHTQLGNAIIAAGRLGGARAQSWWLNQKRALAHDLWTTVRRLHPTPHPADTDPTRNITVVIPTSPIPSHPSLDVITQTVLSVRAQLPDAEIIITADQPRPELDHRADQYATYLQRLVWTANHTWRNVTVLVADEWRHQAGVAAAALDVVTTPLVLFVEHDTPLEGVIPWRRLTEYVLGDDYRMIRLHYDASIHPEHEWLMVDDEPVDDGSGVPIRRTLQWSQRPHLAGTDWYRRLLADHFPDTARTMIEDRMHGIVETAPWDDWRLGIYQPADGSIKRSGHLDGRQGDDKYPMRFT